MEWNAMVAARRLPRHQSRHGMAVRRGAGDAAGSARGVWRALPPIALGHAVAVGLVVLAAAAGGARGPVRVAEGHRRDDADDARASTGCGGIGIRASAGCRSASAT